MQFLVPLLYKGPFANHKSSPFLGLDGGDRGSPCTSMGEGLISTLEGMRWPDLIHPSPNWTLLHQWFLYTPPQAYASNLRKGNHPVRSKGACVQVGGEQGLFAPHSPTPPPKKRNWKAIQTEGLPRRRGEAQTSTGQRRRTRPPHSF